MKIIFYNETLLSGGIEKCIELLSKYLCKKHEIEIVYTDDHILDNNIVKLLSENAYVHKLKDNEIIYADICIWCRIYLDASKLMNQIIAKRNFLWVHSKPRALPNCILDDSIFINKIEKIICVSECVKKEIDIPEKCIVIHNFVDNNIKELANENIDPFSHIPTDCLKLLIVSRLSFEKGFDRVEKFVNDLIKYNFNFILNIIGKGRSAEPAIRSSLGKYKQVKFLGYKENPYPYIKNSDFLLVLSDYETWGNVVSESKALGTPCIVTNFPSAKEQIINGENGIIIPLKCDNYYTYLDNILNKKNSLKQNLKNFKYINEIDKWENLFS